MFLTKQQITEAQDRKFVEVEVPEWGGTVRLASLNADDAVEQEALVRKSKEGVPAVNPLTTLLAASIVDSEGNRLFSQSELAALGKRSPRILARLVTAVQKLNGDMVEEVNTGN